MSDLENGLRSVGKFILCAIAAIAFGPWLTMIVLAWILEPRTGTWGAWPHYVGGGWLAICVCFVAWLFWLRWRS